MTDLHLDWCSHEAAEYAVEHWHYSGRLPSGKLLKIGVWEGSEYIGCLIYSRGSAPNIGEPFGLDQNEICELTRVALDDHDNTVTRILSISRKLLQDKCPGVKLVVSFADPEQDHLGKIYQADNWVYIGQLKSRDYIEVQGEVKHPRSCNASYNTSSIPKLKSMFGAENVQPVPVEGKHKYVYPLTDTIQQKVKGMREPYP